MRLEQGTHRKKTRHQAGAIACGFALLLAQLVQLAGPAMERGTAHVLCAEHGELTHVSADGQPSAIETVQVSVMAQRPGALPGGHEHCLLAARLQSSAATYKPARTATLPAQPVAGRAPVATAIALPAQCPLLSSAPKTSPPTV